MYFEHFQGLWFYHLNSLFQRLTTFAIKSFFLIFIKNSGGTTWSHFISPCHLLPCKKRMTLIWLHSPFRQFWREIGPALSLHFSRVKPPSSISWSSQDSCSRPFPSLTALLWICSSTSMSIPEHRIQDVTSSVPSTGTCLLFNSFSSAESPIGFIKQIPAWVVYKMGIMQLLFRSSP